MPTETARRARLPTRRRHRETYDLDAVTELLASCGLKVDLTASGGSAGRIEIDTVSQLGEGLVFIRTSFEEAVEVRHAVAFPGYQLLVPLSGTTTVVFGDREIACSRPQIMIFSMDEIGCVRRSARSDNYAIFIEGSVLTRRLAELTGAPVTRKLRFEPEPDGTQATVEALQSFLAALDRTTLVQSLGKAPHSAKRLAALLVDLVLELLPHSYSDAFDHGAGLIAPRHVKRAVDFIQANAAQMIETDAIVAVSGVSLRSLQYGFQKFLGVSISDYERSVRLERVKREIETHASEPVGTIARRWGFSNFTRFNTQFEAAFGQTAVALRGQLAQQPSVRGRKA